MLRTLYTAAALETPFSLLMTLAATTTDSGVRQLRSQVLLRGAPLLQTAPCRLQLFCDLTNRCYGEAAQVLAERTLFPFYAGCLSASSAATLAEQVCNGKRCRVSCPLPPIHLQVGNRYGLECPECSRLNRELTGRRCSLTLHCIPFLTRCPVHQCQLRLVANCSASELMFLAAANRGRKRNSLSLAETCLELLQGTSCHSALDTTAKTLHERGYVSETRKLRMAALIRDCTAALSNGFEDVRLDMWLRSEALLLRLLRYFERPMAAPHPTAVAVLQVALSRIEYAPTLTSPVAANCNTEAPASEQKLQRVQENRDLWIGVVACTSMTSMATARSG